MYERICEQCRRVCFTPSEYSDHECFDRKDKLDAEIALANWDGKLEGERAPAQTASDSSLPAFIPPQRGGNRD